MPVSSVSPHRTGTLWARAMSRVRRPRGRRRRQRRSPASQDPDHFRTSPAQGAAPTNVFAEMTRFVIASSQPDSRAALSAVQQDAERVGDDLLEVAVSGNGKLCVNMSDGIRHTIEYRGDGGQILSFDVSREYRDSIRDSALP